MSLIIELLSWGRQAVRESIVGVAALVGIDAGQPSDHRLVDVAAAVSARSTSPEQNWAAGVYCGTLTCFPFPGRLPPAKRAAKIARELARGGEPTNAAIVVVEGGQHLFEVPLAEQGD
jgi:hypothetical protein